MRKKDKPREIMNDDATLSTLCSERNIWKQWPVQGDATRAPKATVIDRISRRMAEKFRSDPFTFKRVMSALLTGMHTPDDYLAMLNIGWPELLKGAI